MARTRFDICLEAVLRHEGGYADHPSDPGGATNMGITHKTLAQWRGVSPWWALGKDAVRNLGRAEAAEIYRSRYWNTVNAEALPAGLDLAVFDFAVNSGPDRAVRMLQAALGVPLDGIVGPVTLAALGRQKPADLIGTLCDRRLAFLEGLSTFPVFGRGWTARVAAVRAMALAMAQTGSPSSQTNFWSDFMSLLDGYKTYIVAGFMLLAGLAHMLGIELPSLEGASAGQMVMEALAVIFLRKGLKSVTGKV